MMTFNFTAVLEMVTFVLNGILAPFSLVLGVPVGFAVLHWIMGWVQDVDITI